MSQNPKKNYAFIDGSNLNLGVQSLGWKLDYRKFRVYLRDKYEVQEAYVFLGFSPEQQELYKSLQKTGYILIFKPVLVLKDGRVKGNCDAELVLQAMIELENYDKAVIVTGDGDFHCLVKHLKKIGRFEQLLAPSPKGCSSLLRKLIVERVTFLSDLRAKLEYIHVPKTKSSP